MSASNFVAWVIQTNSFSYVDSNIKTKLHNDAKKALKALAGAMGLEKNQYSLCSNKGGIAGSGEITLHADDIYIQICEGMQTREPLAILYRTCTSRNDYNGGQNNFAGISALEDVQAFADKINAVRGKAA